MLSVYYCFVLCELELCYKPGMMWCGRKNAFYSYFSTVPVKPLDTSQVLYRRNLSGIVQECGVSFILSNQPFQGQDKDTVASMKKMMKSIPVEWLCQGQEEEPEQPLDTELPVPGEEEGLLLLDVARPEDVAFVQFTTTGINPAGIDPAREGC